MNAKTLGAVSGAISGAKSGGPWGALVGGILGATRAGDAGTVIAKQFGHDDNDMLATTPEELANVARGINNGQIEV
jgi:uncharacterized membrane protein